MTGNLHVKNDKYYIVLSFKNDAGKWKRKWISTGLPVKGNNKAKAKQMLKDTLEKYEGMEQSLNTNMLFSDLLDKWLSIAKLNIDIVTYEGYHHTVEKHLKPYFSGKRNKKPHEVTTDMIQQYYIQKMDSGRLDGKGGLSAKTIKQHHTVIYQAFEYAIENDLATKNPAKSTKRPPTKKYKADFYSLEETKALLEACKTEQLYALILFTVYYGLRRSEVLGLKWSAINFENDTLTIQHTVVNNFTLVRKDETKNAASNRSYPLFDFIKEILLAMKKKQIEEQVLLGSEYQKNDYVFRWPDGHPFSPSYVTGNFAVILKKYGLRKIRFHDLRHSCASMMISKGLTLKDIQEWLGHSSIQMTADIYGHLEVQRKQNIASTFAHMLELDKKTVS